MADSPKSMIELAEAKALDAMDPAKFDFLAVLEDGIVMPTEKVIVFTNARITSEIIALSVELEGYNKEAASVAEGETNTLRGDRYNELVAIEQAKIARNKEIGQDDEDFSVADAPVVPETVRSTAELLAQCASEIPDVEPVQRPEAKTIIEKMNELSHEHFAHRLELTLEGVVPAEQQAFAELVADELRLPRQAKMSAEDLRLYEQERMGAELVAHSVVEVYDPRTDNRTDFRKERMPASAARRLLRALPVSERNKIVNVAHTLTYAAVLIDMKTDAGFPGGRLESEGKPLLDAVLQDS